MTRAPKRCARVLKRARKASEAADVRPTPAEVRAIREKLIPASLQSISAFIGMCEEQVQLLERARSTDLNGMRVTSSLGPIIRFKAGDAFRFPIAHQPRHMLQVERLLA